MRHDGAFAGLWRFGEKILIQELVNRLADISRSVMKEIYQKKHRQKLYIVQMKFVYKKAFIDD